MSSVEQLAQQDVARLAAAAAEDALPLPARRPMTDAEYEAFVERWIGIPYVLNGEDPAIGLDCRTLGVKFLRAQDINIKDTDGQPLPETIEDLDVVRYEQAVKEAGAAVDLGELRRNDLVYYPVWIQGRKQIHVGVWIGYDRILTTAYAYKSFIYRIKREHLQGAVRGRQGTLLDDRHAIGAPPAHPPVVAVLAAIGTAATLGIATGTTAAIIGAVVVGATVASIGFGIGALSSARKAFDFDGNAGLGSSPRYAFDGARNIRSNQYPVPLVYSGSGLRILNTFEVWNSGQGAETQRRLVLIAEGEVGGITDVQLNGEPISNFPGSSAIAYVGTSSPWANLPSAVPGMKHVAGLDLTLQAGEKLSGDPVITCKLTGGRLIKTWNGSAWTGSTASGNPAACLRDYLTLTRERGGCGFPESVVDDASFGAAYDYLAASVTNPDGSTEPRAVLDMGIDSFRPWLDNLQDMLATCGAFLVTDGRKFYLRVEKAESAVQAFTEDQITEVEYWTFSKDERPNRVIGVYIDPTAEGNDARTRVSVDDLTDQARNPRGIVPKEVGLLGVSRQTQAIREVTKILNDVRANWYAISFKARVDAIAMEPGDPITVQHPVLGDGVTAYKFRVIRVTEEADHTRRIIAKAMTDSVYDDHSEQRTVTLGYTPPQNPFSPVADVTNLIVTPVGFLQQGDGVFTSHLRVTWTQPPERLNLKHYLLEWSEDGGSFEERGLALPGSTLGVLLGAKIGSAYQVRVKTVNKFDVRSNGTTSASVTVDGKTAPPNDVTAFDARQVGDVIRLSWDRNLDVDIWAYELREGGSSWETATLIDTIFSGTKYEITDFASGTKTYRIKAIDASGNYSLNAATDSLVATAPSGTQTLFRYDLFHNGLKDGTFSTKAELQNTQDFAAAYQRPAIGLKTILRVDTYASTWTQLETDLNWSTEQRETSQESYTSEAKDIGSIQTGIVSITHLANVPDGTVTLEWAFSDTDANPSSFVAFTEGVYTVRYFKIRVKIQTNDTTKNVLVYELSLAMAVRQQAEEFTDEAIVIAGTTLNFTKLYSQNPNVQITTVGNHYIPEITARSTTSVTIKLWDPVGAAYADGDVDVSVKGF